MSGFTTDSAETLAEALCGVRHPPLPVALPDAPDPRHRIAACFACQRDAAAILASDWMKRHDAEVRAAALRESHGIAWQDRLNIVCLCGTICNAVVKSSPAPLMGTTSDDYVARPAAEAFARHLRNVRDALTKQADR